MVLSELLPILRNLSHSEKMQVIEFLMAEVIKEDKAIHAPKTEFFAEWPARDTFSRVDPSQPLPDDSDSDKDR